MDKLYLTWKDIEDAVESLAYQIKNSGESLEAIAGLPRGGLIPAVLLSHKLNLPYVNLTDDCEGYEHILIVDDICDSGETLKQYHKFFLTATIHHKPSAIVEPTFYYSIAPKNIWMVYPWELEESETVPDYLKRSIM
jgi:hypoxanthine phosphoribosyltransferase